MVAGQDVAITSKVPGTTTDVVEKSMELLPIGPVVFLDTAGVDDISELSQLRIKKSRKILNRADIILLLTEANKWSQYEDTIVQEAKERNIPLIIIINKIDQIPAEDKYIKRIKAITNKFLFCCSIDIDNRDHYVSALKKHIIECCPSDFLNPPPLIGDLMPKSGLAVLIVPIDLEAPKGRIILPQVQTIRDALDNNQAALIVKETEYKAILKKLSVPPDIVICDSQVVLQMIKDTPEDIKCTTFSILFARYKGNLIEQTKAAALIKTLKPHDRVLIAEACSHHPIEDDIGRAKIPRWLKEYVGGEVRIDTCAGRDYLEDLENYKLIIHCGGCMITRREMLFRIQRAKEKGTSLTNYGIAISVLQGVIERVLSPFPAALDAFRKQKTQTTDIPLWIKERVNPRQINKYLTGGKDFIDDEEIESKLINSKKPDVKKIKDILDKSLSIETLTLDETACLLNVKNPDTLRKMQDVALKVKKKVYDNRIVTFAPLYLCNFCVNDCLYCGFRKSNEKIKRRMLTFKEIEDEIKILAGEIGHKRLIAVYGEHPATDIDYIVKSIQTIYNVKIKTGNGYGQIRRVNVNAAPLSIEALKRLHEAGIGTYQVFQETYHHSTYEKVHLKNTIKGNYQWRLYCMHRAMEAGVDDVGLGALFGLYDWKFEIMGLVAHARELEERFGIGAHTISFPRLEPAENTPFNENSKYNVSDVNFRKLITIIRLAVPYTGMILTAREPAQIRKEVLSLGVTQTDASTKIGIGAYSDRGKKQDGRRQQFFLGDTRSLDEVIREYAKEGYITSFCTAGYRCGRTGKCIMELLRSGKEGRFCKLNAVLTFREWLDDFASEETKTIAEKVIQKEIKEIKKLMSEVFPAFKKCYERIKKGERDIYF